jgi:hypothetical protein
VRAYTVSIREVALAFARDFAANFDEEDRPLVMEATEAYLRTGPVKESPSAALVALDAFICGFVAGRKAVT